MQLLISHGTQKSVDDETGVIEMKEKQSTVPKQEVRNRSHVDECDSSEKSQNGFDLIPT